MAEYHAMFKCRLCGEIYWDRTASGCRDLVFRETVRLLVGAKPTTPMMPTMFEPHNCDGYLYKGCVGIADFIGWEVKEENADG